jgi:hypothetical protein
MSSPKIFPHSLVAFAALMLLIVARTFACPYCDPRRPTLAQTINENDVAAIIELVELPPGTADGDQFAPGLGDTIPKSKFRVLEVLKGAEHIKNLKTIETIYFGESPVGSQFLITGIDPKAITWSMPISLSKSGRQYISDLLKLPETGPDRLAFFMKYLEDKEELLRQDAYDEFAGSNYDDMKALAPRMPREEILARIKNPEVSGSRRRLYFTMLGVCGKKEDIAFLEGLLKSEDRKQREGLDAIIGCYLAIGGPDGLHLVEELYLKKNDNFVDTNSALQAVRIAEESTILKKPDAAAAFRRLLDNPKMADLVIPDLARWQDWTAIDRLVELFLKADPDSNWIRVPVLRYLQVCPLPEAKRQLARLEKVDPDSAKRAAAFPALSGLISGAKAPAGKPTDSKSNGDKAKSE